MIAIPTAPPLSELLEELALRTVEDGVKRSHIDREEMMSEVASPISSGLTASWVTMFKKTTVRSAISKQDAKGASIRTKRTRAGESNTAQAWRGVFRLSEIIWM